MLIAHILQGAVRGYCKIYNIRRLKKSASCICRNFSQINIYIDINNFSLPCVKV